MACAKLFSLAGKTALVTGASSGLGWRFAKVLAGAGASVGVMARREDRLAALCSEIAADGGKAHPEVVDVNDHAAVATAVANIEASIGPLDVLINNAGMSRDGPLLRVKPEDYDAVMETNTKAPFFLAQIVARRMVKDRRPGSIVNVGSLLSMRAVPGLGVYGMTKAAVEHMTQTMAREWARYDIRVNALLPGYIETEINSEHFQTPAGQKLVGKMPRRRVGEAKDLDGPLLLLASDAGDFMTGTSLEVHDGQVFGV